MSASGINKKNYYRGRPQYKKPKYYLEAGQRGFFCTCNFREKDCVKEAYNLLREYGDKLYGPPNQQQKTAENSDEKETSAETENAEVDISEQLSKELEEMKKGSREQRFQAVETGANNCVFIKTTLPKPEEITSAVFNELLETKVAKTRFLLRIVPIMATCKANMPDITDTAGKLFDEHFLKEASTFSILFNKRLHSKLSRDEVIKELADLITLKNSGNKADLKNPKKAVIIEVIKGICLISVLENFYLYRKFNMFEVCKKEETGGDEKKEQNTEESGETEEVGDDAEVDNVSQDGEKEMDSENSPSK